MLGKSDSADLLDRTLQEESETDKLLSRLADKAVNEKALTAG